MRATESNSDLSANLNTRVGTRQGDSRQMIYVLISLVLLVIADGLITQFVIGSGIGMESNPFLQAMVDDNKFLRVKIAGGLLAALVLWDVFKAKPKVAFFSGLTFMILYTLIIFWNLLVFLFSKPL